MVGASRSNHYRIRVKHMTSEVRNKLIGLGMVLPLPVYLIYLLVSGKLFSIAIPVAIGALLFHYGIQLLKGKRNIQEVGSRVVNKLGDLEDDADELKDKVVGKDN